MKTHDLGIGDIATELDEGRGNAIVVRAGESDKAAGTTLFVASTDDEDRALDVVRQDWKLAEFRSNPVILDNHNTLRVVGRGIEAKVPKAGEGGDIGKLMIRVQWDLEAPDPSVRTVGHQHLNGFRSAGSVGFRSGKKTARNKLPTDHAAYREPMKVESFWGGSYEYAGYYFEQNTLMEFSSATLPMNPNALQRALGGQPAATPEAQMLERLRELDPADVLRRLAVVEQTVDRAIAQDLRTALADEATRAGVLGLLLPDLKASMRSDPEWSRLLRGLVEAVPVRTTNLAARVLALAASE